MKSNDIIDDAKKCAQQLKDAGFIEWEKKLTDAIESGSTGGEIVMALRFNLQKLEKSEIQLPTQTQQLTKNIIEKINETGW